MIRTCNIFSGVAVFGCLWVTALSANDAASSPEGLKYYEEHVKPLLAKHCSKCHLDGKSKGGLSLTGRKAVLMGGESGPAVVLNKPAESPLLQAVNYQGFEMPPSGKLPAESIAILTKWVEMGLPMPEGAAPAAPAHGSPQVNETTRNHWSFRKIARPEVPQVGTPAWVVNPIDAFVLKKLESNGLAPNPPAAPRELYRRMHYDLVGLPPDSRDVEEFEKSPTLEAYTETIEDLLTSPHHGEHWARYWLDLVRYAESNSYERDNPKPFVWRYRDYVIQAFNNNKPYDQFLKEQLAGDELSEVTPDSLIATGYYRLGMWDDEPVDREMAYYDGLDDVVGTTAQAFLGLTMNCARCHDHKLDPISQADYYRFLGFFRNVRHFDNGGDSSLLDLSQRVPSLKHDSVAIVPTSEKEGLVWSYTTTAPTDDWYKPGFNASEWKSGPGGFGVNGTPGAIVRTVWDSKEIWLRRKFTVPAAAAGSDRPSKLALRLHHDDHVEVYVNGQRIYETTGYLTEYAEVPLDSLKRDGLKSDDNVVAVHCTQTSGGQYVDVGLVEITPTADQLALEAEQAAHQAKIAALDVEIAAFEAKVKPHLKGGEIDDFKSESVRERVLKPHVGEFITQEEFKGYGQLRRQRKRLHDNPPRSQGQALVVKEHGETAPATHVLIRGNAHAEGEQVEPGFPRILTDLTPVVHVPKSGLSTGRRMALAEWMVSRDNPLTARVIVNRIWQWHFGRGIVKSSNNLGLQGDPPTHPELLDWLASELMEHDWDLRHIHRLILHSNTYRMSSRGQEVALAKDPLNDLVWRFDMRRLRAEEVRDSILAVNGTLNLDKMFGPSIYPTIEAEVLAGQSRPGAGWENSSPEDKARRSIYVHIKRSLAVPLLAAFDAADPDSPCPVRFSTTQPTQALSMLNSVFLNDQAGIFADKVRQQTGAAVEPFVAAVLTRTLQRHPTSREIERGVGLIRDLREQHQLSEPEAQKYYCLMALNLNEFIYLD